MKLMGLQKARSKPPWRVFFFGTDDFSLKTLQSLNENMMMPSSGRLVDTLDIAHPRLKKPSPVNRYAEMCGLTQYQWPIRGLDKQYDVAVLASFGHLIPKKLVDAFPYGILNVHPSLLPRWRGAAPLHHTVLNGDSNTGVSIMSIKPRHFDIGPLLQQRQIALPSRPTFSTLRDTLAFEGGKMIIELLRELPEAVIGEASQDSEGITYAHKITQQRSFIDWENQTVDELDRQYRALFETTELRTDWEGTTVRMLDMAAPSLDPCVDLDSSSPPGLPVYDKKNNVLWVRCKDGWTGFFSILIKKKMSAKAFYNGYLSKKHLKGVCFKSIPNHLFDEHYWQWIRDPRPS
ncbi:methionyl-tRNA formyltransferase, mitochondrial [Aplysia californica]|uniref:Methionyl-tRNA formyltransferase, mitochondrial n=1 Tax=Aplysia californica TaxID=6500 RepID=A0ABM0JZN5_APLCA|nr:methionyl-tRNA formyltransferase, mitochondrial [Aplysia californica]